jgi:hypothetical protein
MADTSSKQHLFAQVLACVHAVCVAELGAAADLSRVVVEPPKDPTHGDMATNAAMVLAKEAKAKPRDLAEKIAERLRADDLVASVDVAGPGFINLTLKVTAWADALRSVLREGDAYGQSAVGADEKVNVEYVSANPTGPMHVGHCRGAVFGDALACYSSQASTLSENITSTMPAPRSTCSRVRRSCVIAKPWAKTSARFQKDFTPAIISSPSGKPWPQNTARRFLRCRRLSGCRRCAPKPSR